MKTYEVIYVTPLVVRAVVFITGRSVQDVSARLKCEVMHDLYTRIGLRCAYCEIVSAKAVA